MKFLYLFLLLVMIVSCSMINDPVDYNKEQDDDSEYIKKEPLPPPPDFP